MAEKTFDLTKGFKNTKYSPKKGDVVDIDFSNHDVSYKEAGKNIVVTVKDKFTNVYTSTATKTSKDAATGTFYSYKSGKKTVYTKFATHDEASKLEKGTFYKYKNGDVDVYTKDATRGVANTEVSSRSANDFYSNKDDVVITASQYEELSEAAKKEYSSVSTHTKVYSYTSGSDTIYSLGETHKVKNELVSSDVKIYSYKSGNETIYSTSSVHSVANKVVDAATKLYEKVTYDATWTATGGESTKYEWKNAGSAKTTEYVTKQGDGKFYYSDFKVTNDGSFNESTVKTNGKTANYNVAAQTKDYTLTLVNAASKQKADSIKLTATGYNDFELLTANYTLEPGKKVNGTFLSETVTGTKANETFNLITGTDTVNFKVETTGFGHDTVKVSNGENLTLNLQSLDSADTVAVTRNGDNLIVSATRGSETKTDLGQITIQGYANKGEGTVALKNGNNDITSLITTAVTTQQYAVHKGNKFTGTVFADSATSTKANETYALSTGNDEIEFVGNLGKDTVKLTAGEDLTLDFAKAADLNYTIKGNNVVLSSNVKYYATITPTENVEWDTYTYKKGKTYTLELVQVEKSNNEAQLPSGSYTFGMVERNATKAEKAAGYGKISMFLDYTDINAGYALNSANAPITFYKVAADGTTTKVSISDIYGSSTLTAESFAAANAGLFNSGSVTLQNYMKLAEDSVTIDGFGSLKTKLESLYGTIDKHDATKGQTIKGTFLNETFTGSAFNDKITTGNGKDTITAGKGNDTITLGTGVKTVNIAGGDGNDTIKGLSNATSLELNVSGIDASSKQYTKSGNNLIYEHDYVSGTTKATEKTTIADFFAGSNNSKVSGFTIDTLNISGKGKIAGTDYNDAITGSAKADKITTGAGADTITAGKGNDTITIDGAGAKTLNFDRTSGKDTVVVSAADFESANLKFDGAATYTYDHSVDGNDLIVKANYAKVDKTTTTPAQKASTATVTVKDYFADGLAEKVTIGGSPISYGTTLGGTEGKSRAEGKATIGNNIYDMTDSPATTSVAKTVKIFDESGNDLYNVASLKSNTYINDKAGRDALNIKVTDPDNVCMIFDVVADKSKTLYQDNSLFIFDKTNIVFDTDGKGLADPVGGVEIANFIKVASNGKYSVGAGAIETINVGDETWSGFSSKGLDKLRATVAGWLSENKYDSAYEVLNNGTKDDIQALLALYAGTGANGYTAKS